MSQETETVEQVCDEMKEVTGIRRFIDSHYCNNCGDPIDGKGSPLEVYSDRILAAHKREIAAKDAEILSLKQKIDEYERQPELMADTATKALELLKSQDAEIASLRALVKDLSVSLDASCYCHLRCDRCILADEEKLHCSDKICRAFVAKAREVCK